MFSRRSAGSATGLVGRYRSRGAMVARACIIGLQLGNVACLFGVVGIITFAFRYDDSVRAIGIFRALWVIVMIMAACSYAALRAALTFINHLVEWQTRYIGDMSHAIRTPISIIRAETEVALMSRGMDVQMEISMKSIIEELNRLSETTGNVPQQALAD